MTDSIRSVLEESRRLVARSRSVFASIPLESRLSLAAALDNDEVIDRLVAVIKLHRDLRYERPPWEDDSDLDEFLTEMEEDARKENEERELLRQERWRELEIVQKEYDEILRGEKKFSTARKSMNRTCTNHTKDDLHISKSSTSSLKRRPSFMADTSQSNIDVSVCYCQEPDALTVPQPVVSTDGRILTSTPHVPNRRTRAISFGESRTYLEGEDAPPKTGRKSRSASVHFEDTLRRENTFDCDVRNKTHMQENQDPNIGTANGTTRKIHPQRANTTIIRKTDDETMVKGSNVTSVVQSQPRIAPRNRNEAVKRPAIARPNVANRNLPKPATTRTIPASSRTILPSKSIPAPRTARVAPPKTTKTSVRPSAMKK